MHYVVTNDCQEYVIPTKHKGMYRISHKPRHTFDSETEATRIAECITTITKRYWYAMAEHEALERDALLSELPY